MTKMWTFILNLVDPLIKFIKNFGLVRTLGYILVIVCVVFTVINVSHMDQIVERAIYKNQQEQIEAHDRAVEKRYENRQDSE